MNTYTDTETEEERPHINWVAWGAVAIAMVVAAMLITAWIGRGDEAARREEIRVRAEAVLTARFNDTMKGQGVAPLQSMKVQWSESNTLVATWAQGDEQSTKRCTAPVTQSENGLNFGIEPFGSVPFEELEGAPASCLTSTGLQWGLRL